MYDWLNKSLFAGTLPPVILNFSRKGRTYGFFAPSRWDDGSNVTHEISLNPSHLKERPAIEVASTLAHEMCHLWQHLYGTPSRTGYHNREWAEKMEEVGLIPSDTGEPGGKKTGQHMTHFIAPGGRFVAAFTAMPKEYLLPWQGIPERTSRTGGSPGGNTDRRKIKYSCPIGHGNVWGKPDLLLVCGVCGNDYVPEG